MYQRSPLIATGPAIPHADSSRRRAVASGFTEKTQLADPSPAANCRGRPEPPARTNWSYASPRQHRLPRRVRSLASPRPCNPASDSRGAHRRYLPVGRPAIALDAGSLLRRHHRRQQRGCPMPVDASGPSPIAWPAPMSATALGPLRPILASDSQVSRPRPSLGRVRAESSSRSFSRSGATQMALTPRSCSRKIIAVGTAPCILGSAPATTRERIRQ